MQIKCHFLSDNFYYFFCYEISVLFSFKLKCIFLSQRLKRVSIQQVFAICPVLLSAGLKYLCSYFYILIYFSFPFEDILIGF